MKGQKQENQIGERTSRGENHISETLSEALSSNDKIIEIRPANRSTGMGLKRLMLLGAAAVGFAYWLRNSQKPDELIDNVKEGTANRTHQAAEKIQKGTETASERIEEGSERASEAVHEAGEKASERTEKAGEKAAERTEKAGAKAEEGTDSDSSRSSRTNKRDSGSSRS